MGLLLRISFELDRARRQRGDRAEMTRVDRSGFTVTNEQKNSGFEASIIGKKNRVEPKMGATV